MRFNIGDKVWVFDDDLNQILEATFVKKSYIHYWVKVDCREWHIEGEEIIEEIFEEVFDTPQDAFVTALQQVQYKIDLLKQKKKELIHKFKNRKGEK